MNDEIATKQNALKLIGFLVKSAVHHYAVANGGRRGSSRAACRAEFDAAQKLCKSFGVIATDDEIGDALGF